ncbi:MAG: 3-dehydroquinate synthase [Phycisphaerae bacterium]|nr:3-dehydroquinate synthase [Phycisphaerae bacterium]
MPGMVLHIEGKESVVEVETGLLGRVGERIARLRSGPASRANVQIVTDENVAASYLEPVAKSLRASGCAVGDSILKPGEATKSVGTAERLFEDLARRPIGRDGLILALGGGVVSDVAGFAAATWMRGIRWITCPTTLEAMIDASIGGKTGVNLAAGKNLVGAFHPPELVLIDPSCLKTLDTRDIRAGLAESVKHALIEDEAFLAFHEEHLEDILHLAEPVLAELILKNVTIKGAVVEADPRETTGQRAALNLGHTIGHAVEQHCGYTLRHGECVSIGLVAACRLSQACGLLEARTVDRVERLLLRLRLPVRIDPVLDVEALLETMRLDKKAAGGAVRFVLLEGIGRPVLQDDIDVAAVRGVLRSMVA